jgi:phosphoribosylformylglycinamidine (FGAM) synthase-like amidotransferase family enzyme
MTDRLTEIERWYGKEMNVEKTKVMRISRQTSAVHIMTDKKQLENVEYFVYVGGLIAGDARRESEVKSRIVMASAAISKK